MMPPHNAEGRLPGKEAASNTQSQATGFAIHSKTVAPGNAVTWRNEALRVISVLAHTRQPFTPDTLLQLLGYPPSSKMIGSAFATAKQQHIIEPVGAAVAEDGRLVRVWVRHR
jgi:hypothetical protein